MSFYNRSYGAPWVLDRTQALKAAQGQIAEVPISSLLVGAQAQATAIAAAHEPAEPAVPAPSIFLDSDIGSGDGAFINAQQPALAAPNSSIFDSLGQWTWIIGAGIGVAVIVAGVIAMRKHKSVSGYRRKSRRSRR